MMLGMLYLRGELDAYQTALAFGDGEAGGSNQDSWGETPPAGLKLDAFKKWGRKHLKCFQVPVFGYVDFNEPKPLPIEPL